MSYGLNFTTNFDHILLENKLYDYELFSLILNILLMLEQKNHTLHFSQFLEKYKYYRYINFLKITITRFVFS